MEPSILEGVMQRLGPGGMGEFCSKCGEPGVRREQEAGVERFRCPAGHVALRAFIFDGKASWSYEHGILVHETVGAVIRRDDRTLLFRRTRFPPGHTIPAGHVEEGRDIEEEMRREVMEEVGLRVVRARRVWDEPQLIQEKCRRGADHHRWHLFLVEAEGDPVLGPEGDSWDWYGDEDVFDLATRRLLTPATREIFQRLGVV